MLYDQCESHFASDFHRQPGGLGRKEFFADAFAAIASRQRPGSRGHAERRHTDGIAGHAVLQPALWHLG